LKPRWIFSGALALPWWRLRPSPPRLNRRLARPCQLPDPALGARSEAGRAAAAAFASALASLLALGLALFLASLLT
jgi:hypothetical protein